MKRCNARVSKNFISRCAGKGIYATASKATVGSRDDCGRTKAKQVIQCVETIIIPRLCWSRLRRVSCIKSTSWFMLCDLPLVVPNMRIEFRYRSLLSSCWRRWQEPCGESQSKGNDRIFERKDCSNRRNSERPTELKHSSGKKQPWYEKSRFLYEEDLADLSVSFTYCRNIL